MSLKKMGVPSRTNEHTKKVQYHAGIILSRLEKEKSKGCFCMLGITMADIYPK